VNQAEAIATVIGGFAALGALIWAMLGNPSLLQWFTRWRRKRPLPSRPERRQVVDIGWRELEAAASAFVAKNTTPYDVVVGVQPDGTSLANWLAGKLNTRQGLIDKQYPESKRMPFFVFDSGSHARSSRISVTRFMAPADLVQASRILVVDGVTTFGNALIKAQEAILKEFNGAQVDFYVFAVDQPRLAAVHPEIVPRVSFEKSIDNHAVWLHFPWDPT